MVKVKVYKGVRLSVSGVIHNARCTEGSEAYNSRACMASFCSKIEPKSNVIGGGLIRNVKSYVMDFAVRFDTAVV